MDEREEEGLRAFALKVDASSDSSLSCRPRWIERNGVRTGVSAVEAEWREEERLGFRVKLAGGASLLLYYVPELDLWSGVWPGRETKGVVRRRQ